MKQVGDTQYYPFRLSVFQILNTKLFGGIKGPIPLLAVASNTIDEVNEIIRLLHDAGFVAGLFKANKLLKCEQDQVTHAYRSLYNKLILLKGKCDPTD